MYEPTRLRSYSLPHELGITQPTICEAVLATSAISNYFDPVHINDQKFMPSPLAENNPIEEVEGEASNIWFPESGDLIPRMKRFLSIGSGEVSGIPIQTAKKFGARWREHTGKEYFRLNVEQGLQNIKFNDRNLGAIESATDSYLTHQVQKNAIRDYVRGIVQDENPPLYCQ
jgi:hypothetical protein